MISIRTVHSRDARFTLQPGEGADAVHGDPQYSFAVTQLETEGSLSGVGLVLTMGAGNELVCKAIELLAPAVQGKEIEELMASFGRTFRAMADHHQLRWLGPHKGVVHLAVASITNACFDLWAKSRGVPLWRLLLDLSSDELVNLLDLSYLEDVLTREEAKDLLAAHQSSRQERSQVLARGYTGYDTSVGWFQYSDGQIREKVLRSIDQGFQAFKLKVGSPEIAMDMRRAQLLRELAGDACSIMLDANQQWTLPAAISACRQLSAIHPYWIEEPTHPDDVFAHQTLSREVNSVAIALGEHVPNRVLFKNFLLARCVNFLQPDCTRLGGVSEFLSVSLLARKFNVPVVPHVGDMGQIHQHLVLFNHVGMGHPEIFLEHIPHLQQHFLHPVCVEGGVYRVPQEPGSSSDLI